MLQADKGISLPDCEAYRPVDAETIRAFDYETTRPPDDQNVRRFGYQIITTRLLDFKIVGFRSFWFT